MVESFNPLNVWPPFGAFSMGIVQGDGRIVHLKGQVLLDRKGRIVGKGNMERQLRQTLDNIKSVLAHVGGTMADIISLTHYVTDIKRFMDAGAVRREYFVEPFPVTTTVEISSLYDPDLMVEIAAIAEIPIERFEPPAASA